MHCPRCKSKAVCLAGAASSAGKLTEKECIICGHCWFEWKNGEPVSLRRLKEELRKRNIPEIEIQHNISLAVEYELNRMEYEIQTYGIQIWRKEIPVVRMVPPDAKRSGNGKNQNKKETRQKEPIYGNDFDT